MDTSRWKVAGTYVTGLSHINKEIGCQDRFAFKIANNVTSISIADGAGSVKYAELGSIIVANQINETITKNFDLLFNAEADEARHKLTHAIRTRLGIHAKRYSASIKDFASTLIFASVKDGKYIAGHIGDGILGFVEKNELKILSPPDNGEFVNETYFVTSRSYKTRLRIYKGELGNISGFVMMTDGSCESLYDKKNVSIAPIVLTLFNWLDNFPIDEVNNALYENFENLIKRKTTDDCSIGLMKLSKHTFVISESELIND